MDVKGSRIHEAASTQVKACSKARGHDGSCVPAPRRVCPLSWPGLLPGQWRPLTLGRGGPPPGVRHAQHGRGDDRAWQRILAHPASGETRANIAGTLPGRK